VHRAAVLCCGIQRLNYKWPLRRHRHRRKGRAQNILEKFNCSCGLNWTESKWGVVIENCTDGNQHAVWVG
jgi:hypothetical protein